MPPTDDVVAAAPPSQVSSSVQEEKPKEPKRLTPYQRSTGDFVVKCPKCGAEFNAGEKEEQKPEPKEGECPDCHTKYDVANEDRCPNCKRWTGR